MLEERIAALEGELQVLRERLEAVIRDRDYLARQLLTPGLSEEEREALRQLWGPRCRQKDAGEGAG